MNNRIKNCANINTAESINNVDYDYYIATETGTDIINSPVDGAFYAYRKVYKVPNINSDGTTRSGCKTIVELIEAYPTPGRIWINVYNTDTLTFSGWKYFLSMNR